MNLNQTIADLIPTFTNRARDYADKAAKADALGAELQAQTPLIKDTSLALGIRVPLNSYQQEAVRFRSLSALNARRLAAANRGNLLVSGYDGNDPLPDLDAVRKYADGLSRVEEDKPGDTDTAGLQFSTRNNPYRIA